MGGGGGGGGQKAIEQGWLTDEERVGSVNVRVMKVTYLTHVVF